jgi:hypothetical protein
MSTLLELERLAPASEWDGLRRDAWLALKAQAAWQTLLALREAHRAHRPFSYVGLWAFNMALTREED